MFGIAPDANIIDISHFIPRYSIRYGAGTLVFALPYMPVGIHVAVVDPGVGTSRLAIALRVARGDVLIGPDNGLLIPAADALGGIVEARSIENRDLMRPEISSSFHGRDIFAPVAAHLATGVPFESVGPSIPLDRLVQLALPKPVVSEGRLDTVITGVMIFGNVTFAGTPADLEAAIGPLRPGQELVVEFDGGPGQPPTRERTTWQRTFGDVPQGDSLVMPDSEGQLSFADNQGDAATRLGLRVDRAARITAA
jgi:S-adenosylmethionine hydrolase